MPVKASIDSSFERGRSPTIGEAGSPNEQVTRLPATSLRGSRTGLPTSASTSAFVRSEHASSGVKGALGAAAAAGEAEARAAGGREPPPPQPGSRSTQTATNPGTDTKS